MAMAHDAMVDQTTSEDTPIKLPSLSKAAIKRHIEEIEPSNILEWADPIEALSQFHALVQHPPLHSLVIHIEPVVAKQLLLVTNERNRPQNKWHATRIAAAIRSENYEITGDTIKFSKTGRCLDGQHRLRACERSGQAIISHVVFGLDDAVFDVLDQGKKRTAGDILHLAGIDYPVLTAAALSWVVRLQEGVRDRGSEAGTPRSILKLAMGPMKGITEWTRPAMMINAAYRNTPTKHPPAMVAALLYLIAQHSPAVAEEFANAWTGARIGRNKNFDVLHDRMIKVRNQSGGELNKTVHAAMLVQTFNHWHAGELASPRAITYRLEWDFPKLEFDTTKFKAQKQAGERADTSVKAEQSRVLEAMINRVDEDAMIEFELAELSAEANVGERSLREVLRTLEADKMIRKIADATTKNPFKYQVTLGK